MRRRISRGRQFDRTFPQQLITKEWVAPKVDKNYYLEPVTLSCWAEYLPDELFISLDTYQVITSTKLAVLDARMAKYQARYRFIGGEIYIDHESIKKWLQIDKKPYATKLNKALRLLLEDNLQQLFRQPAIWLYGLNNGWPEDHIEDAVDRAIWEDPHEQWRENMAELERFAMLGF